MLIRFSSILALCLVVTLSCRRMETARNENPLARVFDKYLYPSDLADVISEKLSASDSTIIARDYIDKWIRKQLILNRAELNLSDEQKNVEKQIDDYRTSLLVFKYEQILIDQKLDTIIDSSEIEDYYNKNTRNFMLNDNLVRALFIQIPKTSPSIYQVRRWYRSDNDDDLDKLESYCYQYAVKYDYFNDDWIYFNEVEKSLPDRIVNPEGQLRYRKYFEMQDDKNYYFVKIRDYHLAGSPAPLDFVKEDIRNIILNKRKIRLINQVESSIYNDALNRDQFTVY